MMNVVKSVFLDVVQMMVKPLKKLKMTFVVVLVNMAAVMMIS